MTDSFDKEWCWLCRLANADCAGHYAPSGRPHGEPPIFNYDDFIKNRLPSDIRFSKLFPNEIDRWIKVRDASTEEFLLADFLDWTDDMIVSTQDSARTYYERLREEMEHDHMKLMTETRKYMSGASEHAIFEYLFLDQDGGTKGIEAWSATQWGGVMMEKETWEKYSRLAPSGYVPLKFWSREIRSYTKLDDTPCDLYGNAIFRHQDQQSTGSSYDNPHLAAKSVSSSPEIFATDEQQDSHGEAEEQQTFLSQPSSSQIENSINNHDLYALAQPHLTNTQSSPASSQILWLHASLLLTLGIVVGLLSALAMFFLLPAGRWIEILAGRLGFEKGFMW